MTLRRDLMTCHNRCHTSSRCVSVSLTNVTLLRYCPCLTPAPGHSPCHSPKFVTAWSSLLTPQPDWHWTRARDLTQDTKRWLWTVILSHCEQERSLGCGGTHRTQPFHGTQTRRLAPATLETSPARQLGNNFTASHDSNWAQQSNSTPNFGFNFTFLPASYFHV